MKVLKNKYNPNNGNPILPKEELEKSAKFCLKLEEHDVD